MTTLRANKFWFEWFPTFSTELDTFRVIGLAIRAFHVKCTSEADQAHIVYNHRLHKSNSQVNKSVRNGYCANIRLPKIYRNFLTNNVVSLKTHLPVFTNYHYFEAIFIRFNDGFGIPYALLLSYFATEDHYTSYEERKAITAEELKRRGLYQEI